MGLSPCCPHPAAYLSNDSTQSNCTLHAHASQLSKERVMMPFHSSKSILQHVKITPALGERSSLSTTNLLKQLPFLLGSCVRQENSMKFNEIHAPTWPSVVVRVDIVYLVEPRGLGFRMTHLWRGTMRGQLTKKMGVCYQGIEDDL